MVNSINYKFIPFGGFAAWSEGKQRSRQSDLYAEIDLPVRGLDDQAVKCPMTKTDAQMHLIGQNIHLHHVPESQQKRSF